MYTDLKKANEDEDLKKRRDEWMNRIAEADKPKETDQRREIEEEHMTYDLDELFDDINKLKEKM